MNDVQQALLVKGAYRPPVGGDKTAVVTANGHVTIATASNLNVLFQFTVDQWREIVEFIDTVLWDQLRDKPEAEKDWIDWSKVPEGFDWAAVDGNGRAFAFNCRPVISDDVLAWVLDTGEDDEDFISLQQSPDRINWKKSLRKRPTSK